MDQGTHRATATATSMQAPAARRAHESVRAFTYVSGVRYAGPTRRTCPAVTQISQAAQPTG